MKTDWSAVQEHLDYLGLDPTETPVIFAAWEKDACRHFTKNGSPISADVERLLAQHPGRSLGLIVNPGGTKKSQITEAIALFTEDDSGTSLDQQMVSWQSAGMPEPSISVFTGNKSIHHYWVLAEPITPDQFTILQRRLAAVMQAANPGGDADSSLDDPCQVMRVAGAIHPKTGKAAEIRHASAERFLAEELTEAIAEAEQRFNIQPSTTTAINRRNPVAAAPSGSGTHYKHLTAAQRHGVVIDALKHCPDRGKAGGGGYPTAMRILAALVHEFGAVVACDLAAQADWSQDSDWDIEKTAASLEADPPATGKRSSIWTVFTIAAEDPADPDNPWICPWPTETKPHAEPPAPAQPELQPEQAASVADAIAETNLAASLTLDPLALIGGELGQSIANRAERLHVPSSVLINGLLPVAASQLPRSVRVQLSEDSDFSQPPIIWSLSVAPTGSNKSETSDVAVRPLYRFQDDLPPDQERHYFTSSFTLPGLARVQAAQPERGCLINPDELSGFVRNLQNEQARGRGDELSRMLSIYDGRPIRGNFSDKSLNYNLKGSSFSLLSTIQPSVLLECMGDLDDSSGLWARFNLCEIPAKRRRITRTGRSGDGLMPALQAAYLCLQQWEPLTYGLTDEAAELFDAFYDSCEDQRLDQTLQPALQAYAAKQEGRCGRIALVLHCLQAAARKTPPTHLISAETMLGAITICDFYQQQLRRFYTLALAQISESLEGNALLVFEFIKREAGKHCTVRQINKGPRALRRMSTKQIEESLALLTQQNLIRRSGDSWYLTTV